MKKSVSLVFLLFSFAIIFAQPGNDNCAGATTVLPNGTCYDGTTVGANDSWLGTVGCQSGNNHPEVWYSFVATGTSLNINITAGTLTGNIEFILVSATGPCTGLANAGSLCGASPLTGTINGIQIGTTYYYTISSSTSSQGTFATCVTMATPPPLPGQDCGTSAILCNNNSFSQGTFVGVGVPENINANSCFGGNERQSKWYKFTAGCSGTFEFLINPNINTEDFDWAIWNTTAGCYSTGTTMGVPLACNWSACPGNTGITTANPCTVLDFDCTGNPNDCVSSQISTTALNLVAGQTYSLLIDNFTSSGGGFSISFGGTATIGPNANFTATNFGCGTYNFTKTCLTSNSTFLWQFGDGTTAITQNASHTYSTFGNFVITLQVTDALGCVTTYSQTINIVSTPLPTVTTPVTYCVGAVASPLTAAGTGLLWYTTPTGGVGLSTAPTPSTAAAGITSYYVSQTIGGCESARVQIDVIVNPILSPTINCGVSTTSSVTFTWSTVSGATGYNVSYQINTGSPVNIGAIGNVLFYQVFGLSGGDNVTISVTPTGSTCFVASSLSCTAISCLPPTANINYASPFCSNNTIAQQVSLTGTGAYTGGVYSSLPGLTLNSTTGAIIPSSSVPGNYTVTYIVAASGGCPGAVATTSVTIYSVTPSVSIVANTASICTGGSVTLTATPINGGTTPTYQWKINGVNVTGQTASTFTTTALNNGDIVTVTMSSNDPCANPITAASNPITITATSVTPSVSIISSTTSVCTGGSVTFTATPTNGGTTPTYQWKINGVNVTGQTASIFTTTTLNNGDVVTVTMSSSDPCANPVTAASNPITITATSVVPSVSIVSSTTSICTGGSVTFTATPTNGGTTPTYQWKINGVNVTGQTAATFTTTTLNNGDIVTVTMSSSDPCANPVIASSNPITVTATLVSPSVSIASSTTSICSGGSVTFTATPTNGGTTPTYQWKVNGVNVTGQTASTFTTTTLNNGDIVTVTMSSSDPCANPVIASSNPITVTATLVIPSVSIASSTTSICTGGSVTFTATPTNGGTTPTYQWKINGLNVTGQTASMFITTTLNNGDVVTVTMSSSDPCANPVTSASNPITITATPVMPSVSIASSTTSVCSGGSVTFTATPTNGGTTPTYQWKVNGVNVSGQTASTFTTTTLNNGDVVTVTMSSSDPCANPTIAASNTVAVTVSTVPLLIINNPQIVCAPSTVDLTAPAITSGSSTGTTYSYWSDAANTIPVSNPNAVAASGTYYIRSQSAGGCFTTKPVTLTIESKITGIRYPDITITVNTPVALQARSLQPNSTYQWSPTRGLNISTNRDVVFSFDQKTEFLITITSPAGCVTVDTLLVNIEITQFGIFVPRAWTPNGDGHNDLLFPLTLNITKINFFRIFNRWGQLMFETNTLNAGWNGIYKGNQQSLDVYTWSAEAVTITGEVIRRSGNSVLIR